MALFPHTVIIDAFDGQATEYSSEALSQVPTLIVNEKMNPYRSATVGSIVGTRWTGWSNTD